MVELADYDQLTDFKCGLLKLRLCMNSPSYHGYDVSKIFSQNSNKFFYRAAIISSLDSGELQGLVKSVLSPHELN